MWELRHYFLTAGILDFPKSWESQKNAKKYSRPIELEEHIFPCKYSRQHE